MMLLDTNVVSELRRAERGACDPRLLSFFADLSVDQCYISTITLMELEVGVLGLARKDVRAARGLRAWLDGRVRPAFSGRILGVDGAVALECAKLHVPDRKPLADSLIAATAIVHGLTVATRNVKDFEPMGVPVINPWRGHPVPRDVPAARGAASSDAQTAASEAG